MKFIILMPQVTLGHTREGAGPLVPEILGFLIKIPEKTSAGADAFKEDAHFPHRPPKPPSVAGDP